MPDSNVTIEELLAHEAWVHALAHSLVRDAGEADDVEQATWLAALESPPSHRHNLRAWLGRVVRRRRLDFRRAKVRRVDRERHAQPRGTPSGPEELLVRGEQRVRLAQEVLRLDEPYRSTVLLRFYEEVEPREIARIQGVPIATVRTRQHRAIQQLRQRLAGPNGDIRLVLAPIVGPSPFVAGPVEAEVLVATAKTKLWAGVIALTTVTASVAWITLSPGGSSVEPPWTDAATPERLARDGAPDAMLLSGSPRAGGSTQAAATESHASGGQWDVQEGTAASAGTIVGLVKDDRGLPIARVAAILLAEGSDTEQRVATTDADGRFHFEGVDEPSRVLWLHYGRAELRRRVRTGARAVVVILGLDPTFPEGVSYERAAGHGVLGGTVHDAMGAALSGYEVRLIDEGGRVSLQTTVTDDGGQFIFENLDDGVHGLVFVAEATQSLFTRARVGQWLSVTLRATRPIEGVVVAADTGEPVEGVLVEASPDSEPKSGHRRARTGKDGVFSFAVPDGTWRLTVGNAAVRIVTESPDCDFLPQDIGPVPAGSTDLRVALQRGAVIAGELRGPDGGTWTLGASVRSTPITLEGKIDYEGIRIALAKTDGTFRIPGLSDRLHVLTVTAAPEGPAVFALVPRVAAGTTGLIIDLRMGQPITIRLADAFGNPLQVTGGWIQVRPWASEPGGPQAVSAKSREDGLFVTPALDPVQTYAVLAGGFRGYVNGETSRVRAGDTDVVVRLQGVRFAGRLLDASGEPVAHARLEAWAVGADIPTHAWTETDTAGAFIIPGAPRDLVQVVVLIGDKRVVLGSKYDTPADDLTLKLP